MKTLKQIIKENYKFRINRDSIVYPYQYAPTSFQELRGIIIDKCDEFEEGTKNNPVDFNDVDLSKMDSIRAIFQYQKFEYIDVSTWNPANYNLTNLEAVFFECRNLKELDLSSWDVSNVKNFNNMFKGCRQLEKLNISTWKISPDANTTDMFKDCNSSIIPSWYKN